MNLAWTLISRCVLVMSAGLLAVPLGPAGCSDGTATASSGGVGTVCPSGEVKSPEGDCACPAATMPRAAGGCQSAGLPLDMPCPPGEIPLTGGGCEPAGVPPEACGDGFEPDGKRGCNAIQPKDDCPEGLMAIPGETKCHEVSPCGSGTWGDIPVEANTVFVDGSYSGGNSDGTKAKPWTTIQAGVKSAEEGAIVAIAAGSYKESVRLIHRPVRVWGRCPSMVEVVGVDKQDSAFMVYLSHGAEVRGLAIRGPTVGLIATGSMGVVADQVWIHHTGYGGVQVDNTFGSVSLTVSSSLIEATAEAAVIVAGAVLTLSRSVVRDTISPAMNDGISVQENLGERASAKISSSVISSTQGYGVGVFSSSVQIDSTLIRGIRSSSDDRDGNGIYAILDGKGGDLGDLKIRASVIEDTHYIGVVAFGSGLEIEDTVIRGTRSDQAGREGIGLHNESRTIGQKSRGSVSIRRSLVEDNDDAGISFLGSDALMEGTLVRDTKRGIKSQHGMGVNVGDKDGERTNAIIRSSVIERSATVGILVTASDMTIEASVIGNTDFYKDGLQGSGISIQQNPENLGPSSAIVRSCLIERNVGMGVMVLGSDATIETSHVRDVQPNAEGTFGDGITVISLEHTAAVNLYGTRFESSVRAGVTSFGGHVMLDRIAVACGAIDMNGQARNGADFIFDDRGGTACGCPAATDRCHVQSAEIEPPPAIEGF